MFGGILFGMWMFVRNFKSNFTDTITNKAKDMREVQEERKRTQRSSPDSEAAPK
jgi:hypothetical protein